MRKESATPHSSGIIRKRRREEPKSWRRKKIGCLGAVDLEDLGDGLGLLGAGLAGATAEDELGIELPGGGDLPGLGDLGVDEGVVVLEVGTETLGLESGPDGELLLRGKKHRVSIWSSWRRRNKTRNS